MKTFKARTTFRVVPEAWDIIPIKDVRRMFNAFKDWFLLNEEYMTTKESKEAWELRNKWENYLNNREYKEVIYEI